MSETWILALTMIVIYVTIDIVVTTLRVKRAERELKKTWQDCLTCEHKDDCWVRQDGDGCYGGQYYKPYKATQEEK